MAVNMTINEFISKASPILGEGAIGAAKDAQVRALSNILVDKGICTRFEIAEEQSKNFEIMLKEIQNKIK